MDVMDQLPYEPTEVLRTSVHTFIENFASQVQVALNEDPNFQVKRLHSQKQSFQWNEDVSAQKYA